MSKQDMRSQRPQRRVLIPLSQLFWTFTCLRWGRGRRGRLINLGRGRSSKTHPLAFLVAPACCPKCTHKIPAWSRSNHGQKLYFTKRVCTTLCYISLKYVYCYTKSTVLTTSSTYQESRTSKDHAKPMLPKCRSESCKLMKD